VGVLENNERKIEKEIHTKMVYQKKKNIELNRDTTLKI